MRAIGHARERQRRAQAVVADQRELEVASFRGEVKVTSMLSVWKAGPMSAQPDDRVSFSSVVKVVMPGSVNMPDTRGLAVRAAARITSGM
jgi:hypothetical protein